MDLSYLKLRTIICELLTVVTSLGECFADERTLVNLLIYCPYKESTQNSSSKCSKVQLPFRDLSVQCV